ncbi:MAG: hypothetical protein QNJ13_01815 [Paracoccaceae bacterium]|nr:hypothetical protein [Paracoccaceae bacterium]
MSRIEVRPGEVVVLAWDGHVPEGTEVLAALDVKGDPARLDIFPAAKIAPVGLDAFLAEGHGIAAADLVPFKTELDGLKGTVVVLPARALSDGRVTLALAPPARHVATFREAAAEIAAPLPIETESAKGSLGAPSGPAPKSDARVGGMVAAIVLVFLAIFVTVFVLMGG